MTIAAGPTENARTAAGAQARCSAGPPNGTWYRAKLPASSGPDDSTTPTQASKDRVARERTVKSVEHAIDIVDLLAGPVRAAGVTQVSAALGMNVSTVHHLLRTLRARGLVEQDPESKLYRLGVRTVQLGDDVPRRA